MSTYPRQVKRGRSAHRISMISLLFLGGNTLASAETLKNQNNLPRDEKPSLATKSEAARPPPASSNVATTPASEAARLTKPSIPPTRPGSWGLFGGGDGSAAGFGIVAPYGQARWTEDWSYLARTPPQKRQQDWFNRLKYIPLNNSGSIWLSLSGESRLRYMFQNHPMMGTAGVSNSSMVLLRNQYAGDLHLGSHVRVYAELINAEAGGSNSYGYQAGTQRERLDLQQGFVELKGQLLGAHMGVMGGRQLFLDAPTSMQSIRDLPNVQQTWDGFRGYAIWKRFRVDLFDFMQTDRKPVGIFSDGTNYGGRLYGAYTSTALPAFRFFNSPSQLYFDAFFIGYLYNGTLAAIPTAQTGQLAAGSTRRDTEGGRLWGKLGDFNVNLTGMYQGGEFRPAKNGAIHPVHAFAVNGTILYNLPHQPRPLAFGVQADVFSGGNYNSSKGAVGTFATPYVPLPYYNDVTTSLTSQNLVGVGPLVQTKPLPTLQLRLHVPFFWRESTQDALYGIGKVYAPRNGLHGGYIGTIPQFQVSWNFVPHWEWTHDIAGVLTSHSVQQAGLQSGVFYMQTLRFMF